MTAKLTLDECWDAIIELARANGYKVERMTLVLQSETARVAMAHMPTHIATPGALRVMCGRKRAGLDHVHEHGAKWPERSIACSQCAKALERWVKARELVGAS